MKIKKEYIITEAKQIKSFMEKNKAIPKACTLGDGTILSPYSVTFLMSSLIHDNFKSKEYNLTNVIIYNSTKHVDTINGEQVKKDDYLKMIQNFILFCKDKRRVPSYITTKKSKTKVSFELYMYCIAKIIVFYQENHYLPNYCTFTKKDLQVTKTSTIQVKKTVTPSTVSSKETTSSTKTKSAVKKITKYVQTNLLENIGCKGRGQCTKFFCSCNALQQMFYRLNGIHVPEKTIAAWAGVTTNGVGHSGIETAVAKFNKNYNKNLKITWKNFSDLGKNTDERFKSLCDIISNPKNAIFFHLLYRLLYGHYEPLKSINLDTRMLEILNSLGDKNSDGSFQGYVENRSFSTQQSYIAAMNQKSLCIISA